MMSIAKAIKRAEHILPGRPAPAGENDARWQAIIAVGEHISTEPMQVWRFTRRWGAHQQADLRAAIATCILEHLLEVHFELVFPLVQVACQRSKRFANTLSLCSEFGQSATPANSRLIRQLKKKTGTDRRPTRILARRGSI